MFGTDTTQFRNIGRAIIQGLLMVISDTNSKYLTNVDRVAGIIYFILFMVRKRKQKTEILGHLLYDLAEDVYRYFGWSIYGDNL